MTRVVALLAMLALTAACGRALTATAGAQPSGSPSAGAGSPAPAPSSPVLTVTGALQLTISDARPDGRCGASGAGFAAQLDFDKDGRAWAVAIEIPDFHGPGTYPAPPARVSVRTLGVGPMPTFYSGSSGTVAVGASGQSGTVDEQLTGEGGTAHLAGAWTC